MDVSGYWKVKQVLMLDDSGRTWRDLEEVLQRPDIDSDLLRVRDERCVFCPDGYFRTIAPLPEGVTQEEIESAVARGRLELYGDGFMVVGKNGWKEENGRILMNAGVMGDSQWEEITEAGGMIEFLMYRYVRA